MESGIEILKYVSWKTVYNVIKNEHSNEFCYHCKSAPKMVLCVTIVAQQKHCPIRERERERERGREFQKSGLCV